VIARSSLLLWLALLAGFSPVLVAFMRHEVWSAPSSTLAAPILIAICLWLGADTIERPRTGGAGLIAAGLLLELMGIALEIWTVAWLGFPVAVIGLALWLGRPSWRVAVLALGLVAIPESLRIAGSPGPESALLSGVCAAWHALGVDFSCIGPVARFADRRLELQPSDVGWTLAPLLAQLGWFCAVIDGASGLRAPRRAAAFAAAVVVVQPLAIGLALGLLIVSSGQMASAWLSHGVWIACTLGALAVTFPGWAPTQAEKRASRR
jgi:hypothetical protein